MSPATTSLPGSAARRVSALGSALRALLLGLAACGPPEAEPQVLRVERFLPSSREGVFLNEDLVLIFSDELQPDSVTGDSFRVVDEAGRPAEGRYLVQGRTLRFQPEPPLQPELADGGFQPGTRYRVELQGFPRLGSLRGLSGQPLESSQGFDLRTVELGSDLLAGVPVFDDASPGRSQPPRLTTRAGRRSGEWVLFPDEPIQLLCDEPLDPRTLTSEDFILLLESAPGQLAGEPADARRIPLRCRFLANHDEGEAPPGEPCARIELTPLERLEPLSLLSLRFRPGFGLRDLGGNPVWSLGPAGQQGIRLRVLAEPGGSAEDRMRLDFLDASRFIPVRVPGVDGTATWGMEGRIGSRFPRAAGSGRDGGGPGEGALQLDGVSEPRDLHAVDLELAAGRSCELPAGGTVVLRAQGSLRISGELVRRSAGADSPEPANLYRIERQDLSSWVQERIEGAEEWTILVAGGDLVLEEEGLVDVATPLLLVAGGRIRAEGRFRNLPEGQLWFLGRGGSLQFGLRPLTPNLRLDPPLVNPLKKSLRLAAVSSQLPRSEGEVRWSTPVVTGSAGAGSYRVRYLLAGQAEYDPNSAVERLQALDGEGPIRLLVELEVPPASEAPEWDPPWIDSIQLAWEPVGEER